MGKVLMEVLVAILIAGIFLMRDSADIGYHADRRLGEIRVLESIR